MQSKRQSLIEQFCNVGSGFLIAFTYWQTAVIAQLNYLGPMGLTYESLPVNLAITMQFTVISVARGYFWRRYFNAFLIKQLSKHQS